jgi:hypothetical protein
MYKEAFFLIIFIIILYKSDLFFDYDESSTFLTSELLSNNGIREKDTLLTCDTEQTELKSQQQTQGYIRINNKETNDNNWYDSLLKLTFLNTNSFYNNMDYINGLIGINDILLIQETMVAEEDKYKNYVHSGSTHNFYSIPAKKDKLGRPSGGMCCFIKKGIPHIYSAHGDNKIVLKLKGTAIIFVYLPNEGKGNYAFKKEMEHLRFIIDNTIDKNMDPIILGDMNVDFGRSKSKNVKEMNKMLKEYGMIPYDMVYEDGNKVTRHKGSEKSWLDHVLGKKCKNNIKQVKILDDEQSKIDNSSDHYAVSCKIRVQVDPNHNNNRINFKKIIDKKEVRCRWNLSKFKDIFANEFKKYEQEIEFWINKLDNAKTKSEVSNIVHEIYIFIHKSLNECAERASKEVNTLVLNNVIKIESWWTEELKHLNSEVRRYFSLYRRHGDVKYRIRSDTLQKKFRLLHRIELNKYEFRNTIKLDRLKNLNINKFWKKIKNKLQKKLKVQVNIETLKKEFEKIFNDKLVNSSSEKEQENVTKFENENKDKIFENVVVTEEMITKAISELNNNKSIGNMKSSNEMFKHNRSNSFIKLLSVVFTRIFQYGVLPDNFNISIIKPLIKDNLKDHSDQNNIRPISVSDTISTIFEKLMLLFINNMHVNHDKQFGFKANSSCQHALFVFNEILNSNKRKKKKTYVCAIDASKAFDKVNRIKLWNKLIGKIDPFLIRALMVYYGNSLAYVVNEEDISNIFKTTIGVKQGGCLSPRLFTIYIEDVIKEIENLKCGIEIGTIMLDILLYADDILLITDEKNKLKKMLNVLTKFGEQNEIKFNGSKTTLMTYNKTMGANDKLTKLKESLIILKLAGEVITESNSMKYLGCYYSDNYSLNKQMSVKESNIAGKIAQLEKIGINRQGLLPKNKAFLFNCYIRPIIQYGVDTFSLTSNDVRRVKEMEGNALKDSLGLFRRIYSSKLFKALDLETTVNIIKRNKISLFLRLLNNKYTETVIAELINESKSQLIENSLLNDINDLIGIGPIEEMKIKGDIFLNNIKVEHKKRLDDNVTAEISNLLNYRIIDKQKIENILSSFENVREIETNLEQLVLETDIFY